MNNKPNCLTLSVYDTAQLLGVSVGTIYNLIKADKIPYIKLNTRCRIPVEQLSFWIKCNCVGGVLVCEEQ